MTEASPPTQPTAPAGWYDSNDGTGRLRWYDGTAWTEHYQVAAAPPPPAQAPIQQMLQGAVPSTHSSAQSTTLVANQPAMAVGAAPIAGVVTSPNRSVLPIVAASLAGLALILALVAPAVAWLPAVAAIVLGIIARVRKTEPKLFSLLAVIVGPVAWLIAIIVAVSSPQFSAGFQSAGNSSGTEESTGDEERPEETEQEPVAPVADGTSLDAPLPAGSVVSVDSWAGAYDVSFGAINWDATAAIKSENMFNADPSEGMKYILVPVTITNTDSEEWNASGTFFWGDVKLVSNGQGFSEGAIVVAPGSLSDQGDLYPGGTATGNVVFEVPADVVSGVWDVDGVFVTAQ